MRNKRYVLFSLILVCILFTVVLMNLSNKINKKENSRVHQHLQQGITKEASQESTDVSTEGFETHLPIVVLDTEGQQILSKLDEVEDPRININVEIIDNDNQINHIKDKPNIKTASSIRYRGNSSLYYDKKQYALKFINTDGTDNVQPVMGMDSGSEWVLNGTFLDKSLIRNYVAYNIAGEVMDYAPNIKFCEVFIYDGINYSYQGLYTMIDSIEQGPSRVNISKYNEKRVDSSYIIRRDRFDENEVMLYNYGTTSGLTQEWLGVKYPSDSKITEATRKYIEEDISKIEKVLYSDDYETFMTYPEYIDVDSFVDYYVINEFFANYDAGLHSTYAYKDLGGKLKMGPVWDYDGAMDNATPWALVVNATAFKASSWFDTLTRDETFCRKVTERYKELRKTVFSDDYIDNYIDDTVRYLGVALERDHNLWGYVYDSNFLVNEENEFGIVHDRNVKTYEEEVERIKLVLHTHAKYLDSHFYSDIAGDAMYEPENTKSMRVVATFFIMGFFFIVIIVRHE